MEKRMLGGRYEIVEKIGEGGMAVVFKAKCHLLNRYVAVKVLKAEFTKDKKFIESFDRESKAAASLSHPNIVSVYDVGVEGKDIYYIVMELVDGQPLNEILEAVGRISYKNSVKISKQIAAALTAAHKNNVIHRDIKPHNIMITTDGRAKVADFGIAKAVSNATIVSSDAVMGSVHYSSPEQARGGYVDGKSDIYSLGILLYEMVTGKVPFESDTVVGVAMKHINDEIVPPSQLFPDIPVDLEHVILKATSKRQSDRYQTAKEMFDDLDEIVFAKKAPVLKMNNNGTDKSTKMMKPITDADIKKKRTKSKKHNKGLNSSLIKNIGKRATAIILAVIVAFFLSKGIMGIKGVLFVKEVEVPDLIGVEEAIAERMLEELGLGFEVEDKLYNTTYAEDMIISQNPDAGAKVKVGQSVKYILSKGKKTVEVPILINKKIDDALSIIKINKLSEGIISKEASGLPAGRVIRQDPDARTNVPEGTEINLVVSEGEKIEIILMIDVIGKTLEEAIEDIQEAGLEVGNVDKVDNEEVDPDIVISQSVEAGSEIEEKSIIDLVVSQSPFDATSGSEITSGAIEEPIVQVKGIQLDLSFESAKNDTFEINIYEIVDDKMTLLYYGIHQKDNSENANIIIKGAGESRVAIYYDTDLYAEKNVNFDTGEIYD